MTDSAKRALVTGAGSGIGRGIARALAAAGWDAGVNALDERPGSAVAAEIRSGGGRAWALPADVGDGEQVRDLFQRFCDLAGGIDLLVNNAGVQTWAPLLDLREEDWARTLRT